MSETNPLLPPSSRFEPGARLGKYIILNEIGHGGMAVVYKAHQSDLDRVVAVKVLFGTMLQQRFIDRFQAEARALAKMNHPNVIRIFEVGEQNGVFYLVMEYIAGQDLLQYLHQHKPSFDEVMDIALQLAEALAYCHKQGVLHRDLKPTNILMHERTPVLIDFGLAKSVDPDFDVTLTLSGEVVGSPAYMSPEQAMGQAVGVLSDVCALGIILYELISFINPYLDPRSLHQTALNAIRSEPVPLRYLCPWVDADFAAIVAKAMVKETADRYQDMDQLLGDLQAFRLGQPILAKPPGWLKTAWRFIRASPVLYLGVAFLLALGAVAGAFLVLEKKNQEAPFGLVFSPAFSQPDSGEEFQSFDYNGRSWMPSSSWRVRNGRLEGTCRGLCSAVTDQDFFGDLRVEFTVQGLHGTRGDFDAFLLGPDPEDAFRFTLGEWGSLRAGIEFGSWSRFPHGGALLKLSPETPYRVTLEKSGNYLRLYVDDTLRVEKFYSLPVKIERNSKIGFYTWNGEVAVSGLRVYKKAVALAAGPTVVADAYQDEGSLLHSIPAYQHVIETYPDQPVRFEAHLKMGKSYMVLGDFARAERQLTMAAGSTDPQLLPEVIFQMAECDFKTGQAAEGYERLRLLHSTYPESDFNRGVVEYRVQAVYDCLEHAVRPAECVPGFEDEFRFLIRNEDAYRAQFGTAHAALLDLFRRLGVDEALQNAPGLLAYYAGIPEVCASLRRTLVRRDIGMGNLAGAHLLLDSASQDGPVSPAALARNALLAGELQVLQGRVHEAGQTFSRLGAEFASVPDIPFGSLIQAQVAQAQAGETPALIDSRLLENDAVSRREGWWLDYLDHRMSSDSLHALLITAPASAPDLEEVLAEYLHRGGPGPAGRQYLQSIRALFPPQTLEAEYLDSLLTHGPQPAVEAP